ncbi:MAG: YitT family protein [Chloroflexi bacterium]|nr:YitT family protein [Chloroflexota bacterium]
MVHLERFNRKVLIRTRLGVIRGRSLLNLGLICISSLLIALSVDIFLDPNDVVPGGFTALAMFANRLWGWPVGMTLWLMNLPFLVIALRVIGLQFGPKTLISATLTSLAIDLLNPYLPIVQGEPLLYTLYGGLLYGVGLALVFQADATTGGTEIPAKLAEHLWGIRMARSLFAMDVVILALAALIFGLAPALYALVVAWVTARVIEFVERGFTATNSVFIISQQPQLIRDAIIQKLDRGVTLLQGEGGYTGSQRTVLFTVVRRRQTRQLRQIVSEIDTHAFVFVLPSYEVLGEGFQPLVRTQKQAR